MPTSPGVLTNAMDEIWGMIREDHSDLLPAVITISATPAPANHGPERWSEKDGVLAGPIMDVPTLQQGAEQTLIRLLHDAAHGLNWLNGIPDTTTRGQYHNARFTDAAEAVGLVRDLTGSKWQVSLSLSDAARARYAGALAMLADAIEQTLPHLTIPAADATAKQRTNRMTAECKCDPPRKFRVGKTILAQGPIICGICNKQFA
ncbi:hypothetical protein ACFVZM_06720 [Streptomyces sioyaensis]|uniref:hypothetical protein n=1 Tax=Streptomyces sioyaensis TaxID=67364 RepID=UPI0036A5CF10